MATLMNDIVFISLLIGILIALCAHAVIVYVCDGFVGKSNE